MAETCKQAVRRALYFQNLFLFIMRRLTGFSLLIFFMPLFLWRPGIAAAGDNPTTNLYGVHGLNTAPSARMPPTGTVTGTLSTLDPYLHAAIGLQLAAPFHVSVRQSALISDINGDAERLYPGIDLRLRLLREGAYIPELTLGLQSAIGHKRMAGEYLAASKHYRNFDFTAGMAWGRLGSAAHMENPLGMLSGHFEKPRTLDGEEPNEMADWFTGTDIGFFAGLEYVTKIEGLSLKADWGADRFIVEKAAFDYDPPEPWSIGFNYAPAPWVNFGAALVGGEKLFGTLTLQSPVFGWPGRGYKNEKPRPLRPYRTGLALPAEMEKAAWADGLAVYGTKANHHTAWAQLDATTDAPLPRQVGRAARNIANHGGEDIEAIEITPHIYGLRGPAIRLIRRDLEQTLTRNNGSPQEIWRNAAIGAEPSADLNSEQSPFTPFKDGRAFMLPRGFRLFLDTDISLSEEDNGLLYRTALIFEETVRLSDRFITGNSLRINMADNLHNLHALRPRALLPVRGNIDDFTNRTLALERSYLGWMTSLKPDLHITLSAGYLEEMYSGFGGEILYRPFGKTFALGAEAFQVFKRDPATYFNMGLSGDHLLTGHINAWYEFPGNDLTLQARIGRYLAEDIGGTLALSRRFDNGALLEAFVTATDQADFDLFGSTTHLNSGLKLTLPLGNIPYVPEGSAVRIKAAHIGRNTGEALDKPLPLYSLSEPLSYRHISRYWGTITD